MLASLRDFLHEHEGLVVTLGSVGLALSVVSLVLLPYLVVQLPGNYFVSEEPPPIPLAERHPLLRFTVRAGRNVLGLLVVLSGLAMLVLPGQGLLTIIAGLVLLEFPGKRRLERWLVARPGVRRALNWLRRRAGRTPFAG